MASDLEWGMVGRGFVSWRACPWVEDGVMCWKEGTERPGCLDGGGSIGCWLEILAGAGATIPRGLDFILGHWGTVGVSLGERDGVRCVFWEACPSLGEAGWEMVCQEAGDCSKNPGER